MIPEALTWWRIDHDRAGNIVEHGRIIGLQLLLQRA